MRKFWVQKCSKLLASTLRVVARAPIHERLLPCWTKSDVLGIKTSSLSTSTNAYEKSASFKCCIVGAGPAGFYTAEKLLKAHPHAVVDIVERLPSPFGLVRSGVAPDHPETKAVINQFTRVASGDRCRFWGNVTLGRDVSLQELRERYHSVVLAYGAESDRKLHIPGEDLSGVLSAREFVWWYNGHPDYRTLGVDLAAAETAIVLGQGNVAVDCARILTRDVAELSRTDIAEHAMEALERSRIRRVVLVGRRGPAQVACTAKETRELLNLQGVRINVNPEDMQISDADKAELEDSRGRKRVFELLGRAASEAATAGMTLSHDSPQLPVTSPSRDIDFVFFRKPAAVIASTDGGSAQALRLEKTRLEGSPGGGQRAVGTGEFEEMPGQLVLRSIGYKSVPVPGLPFDEARGVVPNVGGRVLSSSSSQITGGEGIAGVEGKEEEEEEGLFVVGWLKRGPTGIIGSNLACAEETVAILLEDQDKLLAKGGAKEGSAGLHNLLASRGVQVVDFEGWKRIDAEEMRRGSAKGKVRAKIVDVEEMLDVARR